MKKTALLLVGIYFSVSTLFSSNFSNGKKLYIEAKCEKCHNSQSFGLQNHKVKDLTKLKQSVKKCNFAMDAEWLDEEVDDVAHYLNAKYYNFNPNIFN